jgi:hypothetical protein
MIVTARLCGVILLYAPLLSQTQTPALVAEKILSIGPGAAAGPYLLVEVEDVKADLEGNIYILDSVRARIAKFSAQGEFLTTIGQPLFDLTSRDDLYKITDDLKAKLRSSRDSPELYSPRAFYLDKQSIVIADLGKIVIYSAAGEYRRMVSCKQRANIRAAFLNARGEVVLLASITGQDKFFHVLDGEGNISRSYGDSFEIPTDPAKSASSHQKESQIKTMMSLPVSFCLGSDGEVLVLSPFHYEIRIYRQESLWKTIKGTSQYSGGFAGVIDHSLDGKPAGFSIGYIAPPVILKKDDLILVFQTKDRRPSQATDSRLNIFRVDVYRKTEFFRSFDLTLEGNPKGFGRNGHLFTIVPGASPIVNEYILKSLPGL